MGIQVVHTWLGCVVAATIIVLPLMYRNARAAFEQIDENVIYAARTLGISEWKIFWKIRLPLSLIHISMCIRDRAHSRRWLCGA